MNNILLVILIIVYYIWWIKQADIKPTTLPPPPLKTKNTKSHNIGPIKPKPVHHPIKPRPPNEKGVKFINDYLPIIICISLVSMIFIAPYYRFISVSGIFIITMITIFLRPHDINETYPASIGALIIIGTGGVSWLNIVDISSKISSASLTIIATIVMAVTLESFGFFHWVAAKLAQLSKNSGHKLYWYIQLLSFTMTLLFNNDGSILITTPILILVLKNFKLKPHEQIPYLLSGALIATASSAPIGVSNITNLIALKIVNMTLYMHTAMMFVPCTIGLIAMSLLMFLSLKNKLPKTLPIQENDLEEDFFTTVFRPTNGRLFPNTSSKRTKFMIKILSFVFGIRCLLFVASYFSIPIEVVAILGSIVLLLWRWYYLSINPMDIFKKTPWYILIFAFSMYVIIYGLNNIGLIDFIVKICEPLVTQNLFNASFIMGTLISILSCIFNNHPALMVGTIALTNMGLDSITLKTIYLANIVGSDIGSLLLPIGTLASLMWFYILRQNRIKVSWKDYMSLTIKAIPLTVAITLILLFLWVTVVFA